MRSHMPDMRKVRDGKMGPTRGDASQTGEVYGQFFPNLRFWMDGSGSRLPNLYLLYFICHLPSTSLW